MTAYYNEHDRKKAAWLRELIRRDLIASGDVDEKDIRDVVPAELVGYAQCHFFAGIGVWSYALRRAGWEDSRPVWTVSCPCQPFSAAGKGAGFADERHLWPSWFHLAGQCKPDVVFGEQVESDDGIAWLDLVWTDMEALGYAFGPVVLPAAGVGAPHERHRIWFVADAESPSRWSGKRVRERRSGVQREELPSGGHGPVGELGDSRQSRLAGRPGQSGDDGPEREAAERTSGPAGIMADAGGEGWGQERQEFRGSGAGGGAEVMDKRPLHCGPVNGFWADAEWLPCRDGKTRPVRPGSFPLAHGAPARVVRLSGYGDGLCAPAAEAVIRAYMEVQP